MPEAARGKLGAFIGVFLFPVLQTTLGPYGTLLLTAGVAILGFAFALVLPEPGGAAWKKSPSTPRSSHRAPANRREGAGALTIPSGKS